MSNDEIILQIEQCLAIAINEREKFVWFQWEVKWLSYSYTKIQYSHPGYICRIHVDAAKTGLTWRQRQRIGWRLDYLREKGVIV